MTTWDKIYKDFQSGGPAWATLSEDIDPRFLEFIKQTNFSKKSALDIGCGTGKYLKFLQNLGFKTQGLDSSATSVDMTKKLLADDSLVECADMFRRQLPKEEYDLIISVSTIHHGLKSQVKKLIDDIYKSLIPEGYIFITVPDFAKAKKWNTFKDDKKVDEGTYAPMTGPEKGLPHSMYLKKEVLELFSAYKNLKLDLDDIGRWFIIGQK